MPKSLVYCYFLKKYLKVFEGIDLKVVDSTIEKDIFNAHYHHLVSCF